MSEQKSRTKGKLKEQRQMDEEEEDNLPQHYQVNVVILEGRHLALKDTSTKVHVSIGKKKKVIHAKANRTDSPYYNDFCVFQFYLPLNILLDKFLIIKVYQRSRLIRKIVGSFTVELSTVWSQPDHQFHHKWAVLVDPKNPTTDIKGFLKCDIAILAKGISSKFFEDHPEEEWQENLLVPKGRKQDRHRALVKFSIFRVDNFSFQSNLPDAKINYPYVRITYGGSVRKTSVAKDKITPTWDEELTFLDLMPPLYQNILVEVCDKLKSGKKRSLCNTNVDITSLYAEGENRFLPTMGPLFLYLYTPMKKFGRHKNCCTIQSSYTYACRILMALRTEIISKGEDVLVRETKYNYIPRSIPPLLEGLYFTYKKFILFAAIFDVLFFDSKFLERKINFRVTIGPRRTTDENPPEEEKGKGDGDPLEELENPKHVYVMTNCNTSSNLFSKTMAGYSYIDFSGTHPCIHVYGEWPDTLRRMHRTNVIKKVVHNCRSTVNEVKEELEFENGNQKISQKLKETLAELASNCHKILLMTKEVKPQDTNLYRERRRFYHQEIAEIAEKAKMASEKATFKPEEELQNISDYLTTLSGFAEDPENSFPDTEIWVLRNDRITSQSRIRTEDVAYSSNAEERGVASGKTQTLIIRGDNKKAKLKLDIFVWFGLVDDFSECLKMLPSGYSQNHKVCPSAIEPRIPSEIVYEEAHHFQCRAHIFQAKIMFGFDETGLADPYTRVIVMGQDQATQVRKETLSPVWDETLLFPQVTLYGPSDYIRQNSITITVEVFDQEKVQKRELIGRGFVTPVVKLADDEYKPPKFPPKLRWENIRSELREVGKILMATELLELSDNLTDLYSIDPESRSPTLSIPPDIRPHKVKYRLEIIFWGVRKLRKKSCLKNKVFVTLECGEKLLKSPVLKNAKHEPNFPFSIQDIDLELPEEPEYAPPMSLKLFHIGSVIKVSSYVATNMVPSVRYFFCTGPDSWEWNKEVQIQILEEAEKKKEKKKKRRKSLKKWIEEILEHIAFAFVRCFRYCMCKCFKKCRDSAYEAKEVQKDEDLNWWMHYYASTEGSANYPGISTFKVYQEELEAQPEFHGFTDFLYTFNMVTGRETRTKTSTLRSKVKAVLKVCRWPEDEAAVTPSMKEGLLSTAPSNDPIKFIVRVYIVCGKNLASRDIYGKADPYLLVEMGEITVNDREHYAPKQINPTFGKCFELQGTFPQDYLLRIKVIDYDASSKDDLIGETTIDIENRYYSKHHATCGLPDKFERDEYNPWRDIIYPVEILEKVCHRSKLSKPVFEKDSVAIGNYKFVTPKAEGLYKEEIQALNVLNRWKELPGQGFPLVPEHVETRSLYHPSIPHIEQGKLEMWVDIFPANFRYMPPKVDITPRPPIPMELRAIVWNVDDVVLDDKSFFFNEKMSDIYVKGWVLSLEEDMQKTDVHYRSLNGEGNFNWRFIFSFNYIPTERKITFRKKIDAFDMHPEERKHPCKLEIQIWDNDAFEDDYLGTLILELCSMPRGAKLSSRCTLKMLAPNNSKINLFKIQRTRGWWPFRRLRATQVLGNEFELTGKIDLELQILTEAEAKLWPAGKGRDEPNPLPPPQRPATSFNWMLNPLKTFKYIIWKKARKYILWGLFILLMVFFVIVGIYAFPNYVMKKLLGA